MMFLGNGLSEMIEDYIKLCIHTYPYPYRDISISEDFFSSDSNVVEAVNLINTRRLHAGIL